jgi:hypothetical protein
MRPWALRGPHGGSGSGSVYVEESGHRIVGEVWRAPIAAEQAEVAALWLRAREMRALLQELADIYDPSGPDSTSEPWWRRVRALLAEVRR